MTVSADHRLELVGAGPTTEVLQKERRRDRNSGFSHSGDDQHGRRREWNSALLVLERSARHRIDALVAFFVGSFKSLSGHQFLHRLVGLSTLDLYLLNKSNDHNLFVFAVPYALE